MAPPGRRITRAEKPLPSAYSPTGPTRSGRWILGRTAASTVLPLARTSVRICLCAAASTAQPRTVVITLRPREVTGTSAEEPDAGELRKLGMAPQKHSGRLKYRSADTG